MATDIEQLLADNPPADTFEPYARMSPDADAVTFYFKGDADYSKRLTDHVTLFLSQGDGSIVGCRIKGVKGILDDLPNYLTINH